MNSQVGRRKFLNPFIWFLGVCGWSFESRVNTEGRGGKNYRRFNWGFYNVMDDRRAPTSGSFRQALIRLSSESYWFSRPCRRLCFTWYINNDKQSLGIHIGIPFVCMHYLRFKWRYEVWFAKYLRKDQKYPNDLEYGLNIDRESFSWNWGQDTMEWARDGSTGFHYYFGWHRLREEPKKKLIRKFELLNVEFEQPAFHSRPASIHKMDIEYREECLVYRRPWNRNKQIYSVSVDFKRHNRPPAFSGKGESAWDCDDDGIYGCGYDVPDWMGKPYADGDEMGNLNLMNQVRDLITNFVINRYINDVQERRGRYG